MNATAYDKTADIYHDHRKAMEHVQQQYREEFVKYLSERGKILDLACGTGRDAKLFSELGFSVVGIDISTKMIEKAKLFAPKAQFHIMDLQQLPFYANNFDGIFFNAGILHIEREHLYALLKKLHDILVIGGPLFLSYKEGTGEGVELDPSFNVEKYFVYYTAQEMESALKNVGFEILLSDKKQSSTMPHPWISILARKI
jgi:ubiquinone/menaquinone biosynthesis C-methylase UbiE